MSRGQIINGFFENSLQSLDYPLDTINKYGLSYCNIPEINFSKEFLTLKGHALYGINTSSIDLGKVTSVINNGDYVFAESKNIEEIYLPNFAGSLQSNALSNSDVKRIIFGIRDVTTSASQFQNATKLEEIYFLSPSMVNPYNQYIFKGATHFVSGGVRDGKIYVPDYLVDTYKANGTWSLFSELIYPLSEAPKEFDYELYACFRRTGMKEYNLGDITKIRQYAFYDNKSVTTLNCSNVTDIGEYSFYGCNNLENVNFTLEKVSGYSFYNCTKLNLDLSNLTHLEGGRNFYGAGITVADLRNVINTQIYYDFQFCSNLTTVYCSENINQIVGNSFQGTSLNTIYLYANQVVSINNTAFYGTTLQHIYVPSNLVDSYKSNNYWSEFASVIEALPTD